MYSQIDTDSQEITRVQSEHAEILRTLKRRQKALSPIHGAIAATLTAAACAVWGSILRDAHVDPYTTVTRAYLAWLAFAIVLGIAASAATVLWASVYNTRRLAAEGDRIAEYRDRQQIRRISDQVLAGIRKQQQADRQQRWDRWLQDTGTGPRADPSQVIPIDRTRGARNSS